MEAGQELPKMDVENGLAESEESHAEQQPFALKLQRLQTEIEQWEVGVESSGNNLGLGLDQDLESKPQSDVDFNEDQHNVHLQALQAESERSMAEAQQTVAQTEAVRADTERLLLKQSAQRARQCPLRMTLYLMILILLLCHGADQFSDTPILLKCVRMLQLAGSWALLHFFSAISKLAIAAQQGAVGLRGWWTLVKTAQTSPINSSLMSKHKDSIAALSMAYDLFPTTIGPQQQQMLATRLAQLNIASAQIRAHLMTSPAFWQTHEAALWGVAAGSMVLMLFVAGWWLFVVQWVKKDTGKWHRMMDISSQRLSGALIGVNAPQPNPTSSTPQLQRSLPHHAHARLYSSVVTSRCAPTSTCSGFVRPHSLSSDLKPQRRHQSRADKDSLFQRSTWDAFVEDYGFILTWAACLAVCIPLVIAGVVWALWQMIAAVLGPFSRLAAETVAEQFKWCLLKFSVLRERICDQRRRVKSVLLKAYKYTRKRWTAIRAMLPKASQLAVHGWTVSEPVLTWFWRCWCWLCKLAWHRLQQYRGAVKAGTGKLGCDNPCVPLLGGTSPHTAAGVSDCTQEEELDGKSSLCAQSREAHSSVPSNAHQASTAATLQLQQAPIYGSLTHFKGGLAGGRQTSLSFRPRKSHKPRPGDLLRDYPWADKAKYQCSDQGVVLGPRWAPEPIPQVSPAHSERASRLREIYKAEALQRAEARHIAKWQAIKLRRLFSCWYYFAVESGAYRNSWRCDGSEVSSVDFTEDHERIAAFRAAEKEAAEAAAQAEQDEEARSKSVWSEPNVSAMALWALDMEVPKDKRQVAVDYIILNFRQQYEKLATSSYCAVPPALQVLMVHAARTVMQNPLFLIELSSTEDFAEQEGLLHAATGITKQHLMAAYHKYAALHPTATTCTAHSQQNPAGSATAAAPQAPATAVAPQPAVAASPSVFSRLGAALGHMTGSGPSITSAANTEPMFVDAAPLVGPAEDMDAAHSIEVAVTHSIDTVTGVVTEHVVMADAAHQDAADGIAVTAAVAGNTTAVAGSTTAVAGTATAGQGSSQANAAMAGSTAAAASATTSVPSVFGRLAQGGMPLSSANSTIPETAFGFAATAATTAATAASTAAPGTARSFAPTAAATGPGLSSSPILPLAANTALSTTAPVAAAQLSGAAPVSLPLKVRLPAKHQTGVKQSSFIQSHHRRFQQAIAKRTSTAVTRFLDEGQVTPEALATRCSSPSARPAVYRQQQPPVPRPRYTQARSPPGSLAQPAAAPSAAAGFSSSANMANAFAQATARPSSAFAGFGASASTANAFAQAGAQPPPPAPSTASASFGARADTANAFAQAAAAAAPSAAPQAAAAMPTSSSVSGQAPGLFAQPAAAATRPFAAATGPFAAATGPFAAAQGSTAAPAASAVPAAGVRPAGPGPNGLAQSAPSSAAPGTAPFAPARRRTSSFAQAATASAASPSSSETSAASSSPAASRARATGQRNTAASSELEDGFRQTDATDAPNDHSVELEGLNGRSSSDGSDGYDSARDYDADSSDGDSSDSADGELGSAARRLNFD